MRHRIESPRILIIACPIEYYKYKYQYASLATLLTQEQEYFSLLLFLLVIFKLLLRRL